MSKDNSIGKGSGFLRSRRHFPKRTKEEAEELFNQAFPGYSSSVKKSKHSGTLSVKKKRQETNTTTTDPVEKEIGKEIQRIIREEKRAALRNKNPDRPVLTLKR